jgi:hypothetical protein
MEGRTLIKAVFLMVMMVTAGALLPRGALSSSQAVPDSRGFKEFHNRVEEYEKLHEHAERSLPKLKKTDKQDVIAAHQQALVNKIRELRSNARQGDIFTPNAAQVIARAINAVFTSHDAYRVQKTIQAGEPLEGFKVEVNQKYPDGLPFTTVPPTLLQRIPSLPDEVEYRILGSALLLVDRRANMIIDFMPNAIP